MFVEVMKGMNGAIVVQTVLHGSEPWVMNAGNTSSVQVVEMRCLRSICGVMR